jgi:hypothetical protein
VYVYALFIEVIAALAGLAALGAGLYFARSTLHLIYPELLERPNVLPHRFHAFWDRECLMPAGKEARARCFVFLSIGVGALAVAAAMALQIDRTEALPAPCADCGTRQRTPADPVPAPVQIDPLQIDPVQIDPG